MFNFDNRVLALTGANGGITRAIARAFYTWGARLALSDIDESGLRTFAAEVDPSGDRVFAVKQDARRAEDATALAEECKRRFGGVDFIVTGAGLYRDQLVAGMSEEQWRETMSINLDGVFHTCRALIPLMRDGGAIVNIASMAAHRGSYQHAHYAAAKGAVLSLTRSLALELAPRVRVNAVSPGLIDTPLIQPLLAARGKDLIEATPLKRLGRPDEVAAVIAFLCSDYASFVNGETVHINGGLYMAG